MLLKRTRLTRFNVEQHLRLAQLFFTCILAFLSFRQLTLQLTNLIFVFCILDVPLLLQLDTTLVGLVQLLGEIRNLLS